MDRIAVSELSCKAKLDLLIEFIESLDGSKFRMLSWAINKDGESSLNVYEPIGRCMTAGCIAGWTSYLFSPSEPLCNCVGSFIASRHLGLESWQAEKLFQPWIGGDNIAEIDLSKDSALETLRRFRDTGEIQWRLKV